MNIDKAFEVDEGFLMTDGPFYTGGVASPVGLNLPELTFYSQTTAAGVLIWRKFGAGVNDWRQLSAQDIPFDPTGSSLTSTETDTALKELSSTLGVSEYTDTVLDTTGLLSNSKTPFTYLSLTANVPVTGDYKVDWVYLWSLNTASQDFIADLRVNGTTIFHHQQEPKDAAGSGVVLPQTTGGTQNSGTDQRHPVSMSEVINLTAGSNTIDIQFYSSNNNNRASIYRGRISINKWGLS